MNGDNDYLKSRIECRETKQSLRIVVINTDKAMGKNPDSLRHLVDKGSGNAYSRDSPVIWPADKRTQKK